MQATQSTTIGGREYQVTQLPAKRGLRLFNRLCRILAPSAARALGSSGDVSLGAILRADMGSLAQALSLLFDKLTEQEQEQIFKELLETARFREEAGGKSMPLWEQFDVAFQGRLDEAYRVLGFSLSVNFGSFRTALSAAVSAAKENQAADVEAQTTSS